MATKRKRISKTSSYGKKGVSRKGSGRYGFKRRRTATQGTQDRRISQLYSMIETKESATLSAKNVNMPHNNIHVLQASTGGALNPFHIAQGTNDNMTNTGGNRIGDKISVKGLLVKGFFENSLNRAKVHFRVILLRGAKGETFDRSTIYKGNCDNKIIDQINTERFTVVAEKRFTIKNDTTTTYTLSATGVPNSGFGAGQPTKAWQMWIPGRKFGMFGTLQYENGSATQIKFYDYRLVVMCYDWYGTPQDVNNVGVCNELYTKLYFKDA